LQGSSSSFGALSWRGLGPKPNLTSTQLNSVKWSTPAQINSQRLLPTGSVYKQSWPQACCYARLAVSSLAMAVTTVSTPVTIPRYRYV